MEEEVAEEVAAGARRGPSSARCTGPPGSPLANPADLTWRHSRRRDGCDGRDEAFCFNSTIWFSSQKVGRTWTIFVK